MMAVWFTLSAHRNNASAWFALIAAADIALLERWTRSKTHRTPVWIAPVFTLLCCFASLWLITALSVHYSSGFQLTDSIKHMGFNLFTQLLRLRLMWFDWLFMALSPILAYLLTNGGAPNDRHLSTLAH
jgi:hypothetical protein